MVLKAFAVFDTKANVFDRPFFVGTVGQAVRAFDDAVNTAESPFFKHPNDYRLACIGEYDDASAKLTAKSVEFIAAGADFRKEK